MFLNIYMKDLLTSIKCRLEEFTNNVFVDYERESILLEIHEDYFDEVIREVKKHSDCNIMFVKRLKKDTVTILISQIVIIDVDHLNE